jgi:hypothetical protein
MPKAKKPKILIVDVFWNDIANNANFMGGGQKMILKFYGLLKKDYDISILTSQKFLLEKAQNLGIKTISLYYPVDKMSQELEKIKEDIKKYDILIINNQLAIDLHPNTVLWVHADYFSFCSKPEIEAWTEFAKSSNVKYIVFVSEPIKDSIASKGNLPVEKLKVIPNWIEKIEPKPKSYNENFRVALGRDFKTR